METYRNAGRDSDTGLFSAEANRRVATACAATLKSNRNAV